jgi:hypothetical protein
MLLKSRGETVSPVLLCLCPLMKELVVLLLALCCGIATPWILQ